MKIRALPIVCLILAACNLNAGEAFRWFPIAIEKDSDPRYRGWHEFIRRDAERVAAARAGETSGFLPPGRYYPGVFQSGDGFELLVPRAFARPGDRYVEAFVELAPEFAGELDNVVLTARLYSAASGAMIKEYQWQPQQRFGLLEVDIRDTGLDEARLEILLNDDGKLRGRAETIITAQATEHPLVEGKRVAVNIDIPDGFPADRTVGVTFGFPLPAGALWQEGRLRLVDGSGNAVPSQQQTVAHWSDGGSIKWVRFDAVADPSQPLFVEYGTGAEKATGLSLQETGDRVVINTGAARFVLGKGKSPVIEIERQGKLVASSEEARGMYVVDQNGRLGVSSAEGQSMIVESAGPLQASVRFEGSYKTADGEELIRHITRIETYAGEAHLDITHTLVFSRNSEEVWMREIGWEFACDTGAGPVALFGADRWDRMAVETVDLTENIQQAWALQRDHIVFTGGENIFELGVDRKDGSTETLFSSERMGDWAALTGVRGGFMAAVRDAAFQHPKEFAVGRDRLNILLFSPRGGEELDFSPQALVESWHMPETHSSGRTQRELTREDMVKFTSNAIGWARTHDIRLAPLAPEATPAEIAIEALGRSEPVYAWVDPAWIYLSGALGPLHPVDRENFAAEEDKVNELIQYYNDLRIRGAAFYGFRNFEAGPVFSGRAERGNLIGERRFRATYGLRNDMWNMFVRSGDRDARGLAAGSVRRFLDNMIAHHDGPNKDKGLFTEGMRVSYPWIASGDLPVYWDGRTEIHILGGSDLSNATTDYYVTGNRRAGEIMNNMAAALLKKWSPHAVLQYKRITQSLQNLTEAYAFTGDKELRAMAEATASYIYDPEAGMGIFWGVSDKPWTDAVNLAVVWDILGIPAYYDMTMRLSQNQFERIMGGPLPGGPANPYPRVLSFLARNTHDPFVAMATDLWIRQYEHTSASRSTIYAAPFSHGLNVTQDALLHIDRTADGGASWVAWNDSDDAPAPRVIYEKDPHSRSLLLSRTNRGRGSALELAIEFPEWIALLDTPGPWRFTGDRSFISMETNTAMRSAWINYFRFGKEAPAESYALRPPHRGQQFFAAKNLPKNVRGETVFDGGGRYTYTEVPEPRPTRPRLMLHAPEGWKTTPAVYGPVFFQIEEGAESPAFYFSGKTRLFHPDGTPFADGEPVSGWVELPANQPGFWSFEQTGSSELVEVRNIKPFYTFETPDNFFQPGDKVRDFSGTGADDDE